MALAYIIKQVPWVYAGNGSPLFASFGIDDFLPRFDGAANLTNRDVSPLVFAYVIMAFFVWRGYVAAKNIRTQLPSSRGE